MAVAVPEPLTLLFAEIERHKKKYISNLQEAVAIQSVSAWPDKRPEIKRMVEWTAEKLKNLGVEVSLHDVGMQRLPDGKTIPLPPVLFGTYRAGDAKKTVCIYGHLDVQPALKEDGWDTEPFVLTQKNEKLYGRGSSDDKGPVLCWIHAIEAFKAVGLDIPVNIKFVFEGMEESGSEGLEQLLREQKNKYLKDVDYVCISDNYWLGTDKPCITYGLRGICYFGLEVECATKDLHSGVFGGTVIEGMADLIYLLNTLVDNTGKILIPGIYDEVAPEAKGERDIYKKIHFDVEEYKRNIGSSSLAHKGVKEELLMHRWRHPSLSIHGIEGAFSEPGQKTVIPRKVIGKFSIRIVPNQKPANIEKYVVEYIQRKWNERGSPNKMKVCLV
ncbi:beta-ala-his dipeptidase [Holotrichia oblita]|uniref:Beta-ala-his dipeptidase n=1 Tax=Holotrichia oblita TaxID=644536 RepID=A0ACB9TRJ0_HOLOL|nr:beta-ala-his dipeptidase [Holotrichia oblita]